MVEYVVNRLLGATALMPKKISFTDEFYFNKAENEMPVFNARHYHETFEIYYLKGGKCSYFIDDATYDMQSGDIVVIPPGVIHKTNYSDASHTRYLVNCSELALPESTRFSFTTVRLYSSKSLALGCETIFDKIREEYESDKRYRDEAIVAYLSELFILLARSDGAIKSTSADGSSFVEGALRHIRNNYMNDITLTTTAKALSVSAEHLSRSFKRETGFGFSEYVTTVRLKHAEDMIKNESGKSVSDIAFATGFNDGNYFSLKFKRVYGMTPSEYRRRAIRGADSKED